MLSTTSPAAPSTITDLLLVDTDVATAMNGPSLREKYRVHTRRQVWIGKRQE